MTDREPVNIMGVIAFPNPNKDERMIRFIDSEYHTLFTIKDGESIVITRFDGEKMVLPCLRRQLRLSYLRVCGNAGTQRQYLCSQNAENQRLDRHL